MSDDRGFERLAELAGRLDAESVVAAHAGAPYAACLIGGVALEAALLANLLAHEPQLRRERAWPTGRPPERWGLSQLIDFHVQRGWIANASDETGPVEVRLELAVSVVNWLRNLVAHPGRLIREAPDFEIDDRAAAAVYRVLQAVLDDQIKRFAREHPELRADE